MTASPLSTLSAAIARLVADAAPGVVSVGSGRTRSSGFVWRPGLIVTAEEALPEEETLAVTIAGGQTLNARLVGRDPSTDVALLRVDGSDWHPVSLTPSAAPTAGMLAIAVGASEGAPTAMLGLVSRVTGPWRSLRGGEIDARIDLDIRLPASAEGGVVFDAEGRMIGMSVFGPRRRVLAIPAATIERVATKLESHGRIPRGYLGVGLQPVAVEGSDTWGAMIMSVDAKGPGAAAGLHQGDTIVTWNGEPVRHVQSLLRALGPDSVGQTVTLGLRRGGETQDIRLTVAERPAA